jgi:hypothetical protein
MKSYKWMLPAVAMAVALAACVTEPLVNRPLQWRPTSSLNAAVNVGAAAQTRIQFGGFRDLRPNPQQIAENDEDSTPKYVTTNDDVGAFVATNLRGLFNTAGFNTVDSGGDVILTGAVQQFYVHETSTYKGAVTVHLKLTNPAGTVLWEGSASGSATRFGRSYELENYFEVLSDSLINATQVLIQDPDFRDGLMKR